MKRKCNKCHKIKDLKDFHKNSNGYQCHRSQCKECDRNYHKDFYLKNKKIINKRNKVWQKKNQILLKIYRTQWTKINLEHVREYHKKYLKLKRKLDISFKIAHNLRVRISQALKRNYKSLKTMQLVGCSIEFLKKHLESQFQPGMSWSNYGKWHIDHKRPCASFDLSKVSEQRKCFHYSNLQPLWAHDNQVKSFKEII